MAQRDVCLLSATGAGGPPAVPTSARIIAVSSGRGSVADHAATIGRPDVAIVVDPFTESGEEAVLLAGWAATRLWFVVTQPPQSRLGIELEMHRVADRIVLTDAGLVAQLPNGTPVDVIDGGLDAVVQAIVGEALAS